MKMMKMRENRCREAVFIIDALRAKATRSSLGREGRGEVARGTSKACQRAKTADFGLIFSTFSSFFIVFEWMFMDFHDGFPMAFPWFSLVRPWNLDFGLLLGLFSYIHGRLVRLERLVGAACCGSTSSSRSSDQSSKKSTCTHSQWPLCHPI